MVSLVDTWRTSPELARVKTPGTSTMRGSVGSIWGLLSTAPGQGSPGCQLDVNDPAAGVQVDQDAVKHALAIFASGVRDPGPAELAHSPGLVDVPVQPEHGLVAHDRVVPRRAANWDHAGPRTGHHHAQLAVQLGGEVQAASVRRDVQVEDGTVRSLDRVGDFRDLRRQLVFGDVARAVPRRRVAVADPHDLEAVAQVEHLAVGVLDQARRLEQLVDLVEVVVSGADQAPDPGRAEPVLGHVHPAAAPLEREGAEQLIDLRLVPLILRVLLVGGLERVLASVGDVRLELCQLLAGLQPPLPPEEVLDQPVAIRLGADRDDELAGDVTADDHGAGLVKLGRCEELQPAALRRVHIGDEVDAGSCHSSARSLVTYTETVCTVYRYASWTADIGSRS